MKPIPSSLLRFACLLALVLPLSGQDRYWKPKHHYYRKYAKLEHIAGSINTVMRVRIRDKVERIERHRLANGKTGQIRAEHTDYEAAVMDVPFGNWDRTNRVIRFRHTFYLPYAYDEVGNNTNRFTPTVPGSGLEQKLLVGQEYVLCFNSVRPNKDNRLVRAEPPFRLQTVLAIVRNAHNQRIRKAWGKTR